MLILTPSWVPRFPRNPLGGQNKHFTQLYNGLFDFVYFRISIIIIPVEIVISLSVDKTLKNAVK